MKDETADAIIANDEKIQAAVHGKSVMLPVPGHLTGVAVNACLMLGWMGMLIGAFHLLPLLRDSIGWYLLAITLFSLSVATFWTIILRGHRPGRSLMHRFAIVSLAVAAGLFGLAITRADGIGLGLTGTGLVFMAVAERLIAGPTYAQFTAFFRAKRTFELSAVKR